MLRRILPPVLLVLVVISPLALSGCSDGDGSTGDSTVESTAEDTSEATGSDPVALLAEGYADADWHENAATIEIVTKLRHPVWEVHLQATVQEIRDTDWMNEIHSALYEIGEESFYLEVYGTDGRAGGSGAGGEESVDLPGPPESVDEMAAWMDSAYGPGSGDAVEPWYAHITGYGFEAEAWDGTDVLIVETDLADVGYEWSPEREIVELISHAAASSAAPWAKNLRVEDATGQNLTTGEMRPDMVPYSGY